MVSVSAYRTRTVVSPTVAFGTSTVPARGGGSASPARGPPARDGAHASSSREAGTALEVLAVADLHHHVADPPEVVHRAQDVGRRDGSRIDARPGHLHLR